MEKQSGISKAALIISIVVVLIILGAAGFFLKSRIDKLTTEPTPVPTSNTIITTPEPTPSPTPSFDRSKYTLRILNGTKTGGLAASVSAKLKDLGYQIGKTGNATSSAMAQTTVRVKDSAIGLSDQVIKDLSADYQAVAGTSLKSSDDVDGEVIIGVK